MSPQLGETRLLSSGHSGLLLATLDRFPNIAEALDYEILESRKRGFAESAIRYDKLHALFLRKCKEVGIPANAYPFTVASQGERSLTRWIKKRLASLGSRKLAKVMFGDEVARRLGNENAPTRVGSRLKCLERVEFDGHRIDVMMTMFIPDPTGGEPVAMVIERIWLLAVIDASSRAVLGYHVSLARNYTAEDVLICLENALLPWQPRPLAVPGLKYPEGSGFPSAISELAFARWGEFAFDNAKSNCSKWVWDRVRDVIGCALNPGPVKTPERRQFIERLFLALEQNGFQRLPTTTGSSPKDIRRRKPEEKAVKYQVHLEEMLDLLDVLIAQYNALPTSALFGRSPLEYLRFSLDRNSFFVRQIPEDEREAFCLTVLREKGIVRGNLKRGERLYVRYEGVKYYSPKLSSSPNMRDQEVIVECRTRDLRKIKIFTTNGDEFGVLDASQAWAAQQHDLRVRKAILRCIHQGKIRRRGEEDVVGAYIAHKSRESGRIKKARNELAHALRVRRHPTPKPATLEHTSPPPSEPVLARVSAPRVKVKVRAFNF
ncbi:MAG TPA: hypothetical protein VK985_13475 [Rariglobus sp.]|nr:hypothetical protein [Rariglobus sp.]